MMTFTSNVPSMGTPKVILNNKQTTVNSRTDVGRINMDVMTSFVALFEGEV